MTTLEKLLSMPVATVEKSKEQLRYEHFNSLKNEDKRAFVESLTEVEANSLLARIEFESSLPNNF